MARRREPSPEDQQLLLIPLPTGSEVPPEEAAVAFQRIATRRNTREAYDRCWLMFLRYCKTEGHKPMPASPIIVAEYFSHLFRNEKRAFKSLKIDRASIRNKHLQHRFPDPCNFEPVPTTWNGIIKAAETAHVEQMKKRGEEPVTLAVMQRHIERVIDRIDSDLKDAGGTRAPLPTRLQALRDKAIVLLTSSTAALRTSELASLRAWTWEEGHRSIKASVYKSPHSDHDDGRIATIPYAHRAQYCPVRTLIEWLEATDIPEGSPALRAVDQYGHIGEQALTAPNLREIVKRRCAIAGVAPETITLRGVRLGAMLQAAYDGKTNEDIIDAAGLSEQSLPKVKRLFDKARALTEAPTVLRVERDPVDNAAPPRRKRQRRH